MSSKSQEQPKKSGYKFRASTFNLTPGYSIVSQHMYPVYTTTASDGTVRESSPDFGGEMGRVIYKTPSVSDTVYFKSPSNYIDDGGGGFMPIGADADQESAKSAFYKTVTTAKPEDNEESKKAHRRAAVNKKSIGGTMNRINYFQQGGAAPQQDMQQQVVALVQAAMQGDQKATETVNKIMEAAKAGDQQAMQIAQMIQQVVQQMKGQATSAKWGSKLAYIKSLKYAKGGKACPACEKAKQVEMKACGGKKARKRYFGGLV